MAPGDIRPPALHWTIVLRPESAPESPLDGACDELVLIGFDRDDRTGEDEPSTTVQGIGMDGVITPHVTLDQALGATGALMKMLTHAFPGQMREVMLAWERAAAGIMFGERVESEQAERVLGRALRKYGCVPDCKLIRRGDSVREIVDHICDHVVKAAKVYEPPQGEV